MNLLTLATSFSAKTQTNVFQITEQDAGFHYWHGHTSLDRMDGLQGAIIIDNPTDPDEIALKAQYDEEAILFLQDWYHRDGPSMAVGLNSVPFIWIGNADSFLINGKGRYQGCIGVNTTVVTTCTANCTIGNYLSAIDVSPGKKYLLRIVNAAGLVAVNFAIANHSMTVVQTEGTYVNPIAVNSLDIGVAERYSVILEANQDPTKSYWATTAIRFRNAGPMGYAYLRYPNAPEPDPLTSPFPSHPVWNDVATWTDFVSQLKTTTPTKYFSHQILSATPDRNLIVVGNQAINPETGNLRWVVNNYSTIFQNEPTILKAYNSYQYVYPTPTWPNLTVHQTVDLPDTPLITWNYTDTFQGEKLSTNLKVQNDTIVRLVKGNVVELVLQNALSLNGDAEYHSWHIHGHTFWLVGQGTGTFDPATDPANYNLVNPIFRDTVALLPYGWTAVRFLADNPGAWFMHCAITPHAVMGMGFTLVTSPDLLPNPPTPLLGCQNHNNLVLDCKADSEACNASIRSDCCYGWECKNETCQQCGLFGDHCIKVSDCCNHNQAICSNNTCGFCGLDTDPCTTTADCCKNFYCSNTKCTVCKSKKNSCSGNSECCSGQCDKNKCN